MDISKTLEQKQKELQQKVDQYQQLKQHMSNLTNEILKLQGAVGQLKELDEEDGKE